jgi:hypothetical protein
MNGETTANPSFHSPTPGAGSTSTRTAPVDHHPIQQLGPVGQQGMGDRAAQRQADQVRSSGGDAVLDERSDLLGGAVEGGPAQVVAPAVPWQVRCQAVIAHQPLDVLVPHPSGGRVTVQEHDRGRPRSPGLVDVKLGRMGLHGLLSPVASRYLLRCDR